MNGAISSEHAVDSRQHPDHDRQTSRAPPARIHKVLENSVRRVSGGKDPKWDEHTEKAQNVKDQNQALNKGQALCKERVEENGERGDGDHKKSTVPSLEDVGLVVQYN